MRNQRIIRNYLLFFLAGKYVPIAHFWTMVIAIPIITLLSWKIDDFEVDQIKRKKLC